MDLAGIQVPDQFGQAKNLCLSSPWVKIQEGSRESLGPGSGQSEMTVEDRTKEGPGSNSVADS